MSDKNKSKNTNTDNKQQYEKIEKFFAGVTNACKIVLSMCWYGVKKIKFKKIDFWLYSLAIVLSCYYLAWLNFGHLQFMHTIWPQAFTDGVVEFFKKIPSWIHFSFLLTSSSVVILGFLGFREFRRMKKMKDAISNLGFKSETGKRPRLLRIEEIAEGKRKVIVDSGGFGIERFENRRGDLRAAFGQVIEEIKENPRDISKFDIYLCERDLPIKFSFSAYKHLLAKPYSFIVGQSYKGPIVQNIRELPHMFIAGTTGGGKSVFFNNVILGLLNSSKRIRLYLIDLKNGLEVQDYSEFSRAKIAKNESEAVQMLNYLNDLMDSRFEYLKKQKRRKIDPEKDNMDIIVVAFDEVSEAFDTVTKNKELKAKRELIYEKAHRLSKLSRAAGFSLIFSTQKIKKQLMPTEIQTNIGGRMVFKLPTSTDSVTAIGNKKAFDLPSIKGRAIWNSGNEYNLVQGPLLSDEEIKREISELQEKFDSLDNDESFKQHEEVQMVKKVKKGTLAKTSKLAT